MVALRSALLVRSELLKAHVQGEGNCASPSFRELMGEESKNVPSYLKPLWEDTPANRPRGPETGSACPDDSGGLSSQKMAWRDVGSHGPVLPGLQAACPAEEGWAGPSEVQAQTLGPQVGQCRCFLLDSPGIGPWSVSKALQGSAPALLQPQ